MKLVLLWGLLIVAFLLCIFNPARAEFTRFICNEEAAADAIGEAMVIADAVGEAVAKPYIDAGTCTFLPVEIRIEIVYRGMIFRGASLAVQVVGFEDLTHRKRFFGFLPVDETGA